MTGFGRATLAAGGAQFAVEVRSVNQRNLDLAVRLPRPLSGLEPALRKLLGERFGRGKVELNVSIASGSPVRGDVEVDRALAERYLAFARELEGLPGIRGGVSVAELLTLPGVARVVERPASEEELAPALLQAAERAAAGAAEMRVAEGIALARDLGSRLDAIAALVAELGGRAGEVQRVARDRLRQRLEQLRNEIGWLDEARVHHEVALAAERLDVSEELARLGSHVEQFRAALAADEPVGRRLEFLVQELAREANTLGAKAGDAPLAHRVVDLKTEVDRIREQVQNVE
jgi:uncharacterized protein (TIGR00255 family)